MTGEKTKVPLIDLYARFLFFMRAAYTLSVIPSILFTVIPSVVEESRGNETFGLFSFLALSKVAG